MFIVFVPTSNFMGLKLLLKTGVPLFFVIRIKYKNS